MFYYKPHHSFKSPCLWVTLMSVFIFPYSLPNKLLIPQGSGGTLLRSLKLTSLEPSLHLQRAEILPQNTRICFLPNSLIGVLKNRAIFLRVWKSAAISLSVVFHP